jgi:uncharacterized delta-60 repeat protein
MSTFQSFAQATWILDSSFNGNGKVIHNYGFQDNITDVMIQPDDQKIVATGTALNSAYAGQLLVLRLLPDGSFDPSFNDSGSVIITDFNESYGYTSAIAKDGKLLIAGSAANPQYKFSMLVIQLNPDGSRDLSFGEDGFAQPSFSTRDEFAYSMAVQADNKIVIAGSVMDTAYRSVPSVVRLNYDGNIDSSFGNNGIAQIPIIEIDNQFSRVLIQADGKILVCGHYDKGLTFLGQTNFDILLARFNSDGSIDSTFGNAGIVIQPVSYQYV